MSFCFESQIELALSAEPRVRRGQMSSVDSILKRGLDLVVAITLLVAFLPLILMIAVAIKLESPGPVLFRQRRVGFNQAIFEIWKFRSMRVEVCDADASMQTTRNDPRVTRCGRFIRRTSLDELPQLFNVLWGSMSIVGPRPHALQTSVGGRPLEQIVSNYHARHHVKPGLTGLAQIQGFRGELDADVKVRNRVACDLEYIQNWSIWLDIRIILRTMLILPLDSFAY